VQKRNKDQPRRVHSPKTYFPARRRKPRAGLHSGFQTAAMIGRNSRSLHMIFPSKLTFPDALSPSPLPAPDHRLPKTTTVTRFLNSSPLIDALTVRQNCHFPGDTYSDTFCFAPGGCHGFLHLLTLFLSLSPSTQQAHPSISPEILPLSRLSIRHSFNRNPQSENQTTHETKSHTPPLPRPRR
jgi:hypothetical protein